MNERIYLSSPHMGGDEIKFVQEAFDSNWIAPVGPNISGFESDLVEYSGAEHAAALSSGTAAIHLALIILGIGEGDEVICSTFTFSGSVNPIVYQKALPVFVDSEKDTWNMSPELLETAIKDRIKKGKKPKAIVLVHLYGIPAKMDQLMAIARQYEIPVIEDAAEALGAKYNDQPLGTFGDIGIYSFNGNKIITTSGGGALVSDNKRYTDRAKYLATQARDPAPYYHHTEVGYNYRMSNIVAGIGRGQMKVLDEWVNNRRRNYSFYKKALSSIEDISFLEEPTGMYANRWLTTILITPSKKDKRDPEALRLFLEQDNIESRPLWKPMHLQPVFAQYPVYRNGVSEELFETGLCLPSGSNMSDADLCRVSDKMKAFLL